VATKFFIDLPESFRSWALIGIAGWVQDLWIKDREQGFQLGIGAGHQTAHPNRTMLGDQFGDCR
jgi:hypothetical protein